MSAEDITTPLRIRAHTLLCLQGYKGLGYSPEFTARMDRVSELLKGNQEILVQVITAPDIFCEHCPHYNGEQCTSGASLEQLQSADIPDESTAMDFRTLAALGIEENSLIKWKDILEKVGQNIDSSKMDEICGDCNWRKYPHCSNALDELHRLASEGTRPQSPP